jgi:hypothetical protein
VQVNAVSDHPELLQAVAAIIVYMGGDPYGIAKNVVGVVPETTTSFEHDITQVNLNRVALKQAALHKDPTKPEISCLAALYRANSIYASMTNGDTHAAFDPTEFYTAYLTSLGYKGASLDIAAGDLVGLLKNWNSSSNATYLGLLGVRAYVLTEEAVLKSQQNDGLK